MSRSPFDAMRPILIVASMECRRVAGRFVAPTVVAVAVGAAWGLWLQAHYLLSVR